MSASETLCPVVAVVGCSKFTRAHVRQKANARDESTQNVLWTERSDDDDDESLFGPYFFFGGWRGRVDNEAARKVVNIGRTA